MVHFDLFLLFQDAPEAKKERLTKLLTLWDKFQYFNRDILHKLKDPSSSLSEYQVILFVVSVLYTFFARCKILF